MWFGCLATVVLLAVPGGEAGAEDAVDVEDAVEVEDVVPVEDLLVVIRQRFADGRVLKLDLEREDLAGDTVWVYEAKILTPEGDVFEVEYDARTLQVLDVTGPGVD